MLPTESMAKLRAIAASPQTLDPANRIERDAASIVATMAMIHGGKWRVEIDHQVGYVLVRPDA